MGDSIEHWRATIGQWSGGRPRQCVTSQHHIAQTSNLIGYKHIRFLVLFFAPGHRLCRFEPRTGHGKMSYIVTNIHVCRENCTGQMKEETTNNSLPNIVMEVE